MSALTLNTTGIEGFIACAEALAQMRRTAITIHDVAPVYVPDGFVMNAQKTIATKTYDNESVVTLFLLPY